MVEIELKSNELTEQVYLDLNKDRSIPLCDEDIDKVEDLCLNGIDFLDEPTDITLCDLIFFNNLKSCCIMDKEISESEFAIFSKMKKIKTVQFTNCKFPESIIDNSSIEYLIIDNCSNVNLGIFSKMNKINKMRIVNCDNVNLKDLAKFQNVKELYLQNLRLDQIDGIEELANLNYLNLNGTKIKQNIRLGGNSKITIVHNEQNYIYDEN